MNPGGLDDLTEGLEEETSICSLGDQQCTEQEDINNQPIDNHSTERRHHRSGVQFVR